MSTPIGEGLFGGAPMELGVFLGRSVFDGEEPVSWVAHDHDGDWLFAGAERADDVDRWVLVHLGAIIERWPVVLDVADLSPGWVAERTPEQEWRRHRLEELDDDPRPA